MDPRQRGLFGAAWTVGYLAAFAASGAEAIVLGTATGPRGAIHRRLDQPMPWFDEGGGSRRVYPLFHVIAAAAAASGAEVLGVRSSAPRRVAALGWHEAKAARLLVANLTADTQRVALTGAAAAGAKGRMLDAAAFAAATAGPDWAKQGGTPLVGGRLELSPYAVGFMTLGA
jgi:hypothetical protein